jgi:hypothetical protein
VQLGPEACDCTQPGACDALLGAWQLHTALIYLCGTEGQSLQEKGGIPLPSSYLQP